jgi:hypothetical protein
MLNGAGSVATSSKNSTHIWARANLYSISMLS